ncbi:hypothetical protein ABW19_dt0208475 [Dactylella cylindrospora]|nr:hypothetical protein ABW19_dt0208475 [Dactylella cylindrospora]
MLMKQLHALYAELSVNPETKLVARTGIDDHSLLTAFALCCRKRCRIPVGAGRAGIFFPSVTGSPPGASSVSDPPISRRNSSQVIISQVLKALSKEVRCLISPADFYKFRFKRFAQLQKLVSNPSRRRSCSEGDPEQLRASSRIQTFSRSS